MGTDTRAWALAAALMAAALCPVVHAQATAPYRLTILSNAAPLGAEGVNAQAVDINNAGQVLLDVQGIAQVWDGSAFTVLGQGVPYALNNPGQAVGYSTDSSGMSRATVWDRDGTSRFVGPDFGSSLQVSVATDINDRGMIVGMQQVPDGQHATVWDAGTFNDLGLGSAVAVNNAGQVAVDSLERMDLPSRAALWDGNTLSYLAEASSSVSDINDRGQIIGSAGSRSLLWQGTGTTELTIEGSSFAVLSAINTPGQVVGYYAPSNQQWPNVRAALWNGVTGVDLNTLLRPESVEAGWILTAAFGVNDRGTIVGSAFNRFTCPEGSCIDYGFVLSLSGQADRVINIAPIPEPSTYALMLAGLVAMGWLTQRRRAAIASR